MSNSKITMKINEYIKIDTNIKDIEKSSIDYDIQIEDEIKNEKIIKNSSIIFKPKEIGEYNITIEDKDFIITVKE